jgi:DNA-directed RNA polymerase specialized sigma24 family protein
MLTRMAAYVERRTSPHSIRIADRDDLVQEVLTALCRELARPAGPRPRTVREWRNFLFAILRNQAWQAARMGARFDALPDQLAGHVPSVLQALVDAEDARETERGVSDLESLVGLADRAIGRALGRLEAHEAAAVEAWLYGAGYDEAGAPHGLSLGDMRGLVHRLRRGLIGRLERFRFALHTHNDHGTNRGCRLE